MQEKRKRLPYMDLLNVLSCIFVIGIHCNTVFNEYTESRLLILSCFLNAVYYPANAIFVMLSGGNLVDYRKYYNTKEFFKKRFLKTMIPFISWSLLAFICQIMTREMALEKNFVLQIIRLFVSNGMMFGGIFWFFYMLIMIYLGVPFISEIPEEKRKRCFSYVVFVAFFSISFCPNIFSLLFGIEWTADLKTPFAQGMVIYFLLGYLISHYDYKKTIEWGIIVFGVLSFVLLSFGTYYFCRKTGSMWYGFCGWNNWPAVFLSATVFILVKKINEYIPEWLATFLQHLSKASLGIYCIHMFFVQYIPKIWDINTSGMLWIILAPICIYVVCLCIVLLLKKVPILNKILVP